MMKKSLICAAIAAAVTGAAYAETQVTMYGVLDAGVTVSKLRNQDTKVQMTNGNWMGNRWGLKGTEDLGNGNYVGFKLEQGFALSSGKAGAEGKAFNRESALQVGGDWGQFAFGRFGGLSSDLGSYSILGGTPFTTSFQPIGDVYSAFYLSDRMDNSIVYVSPEFGGLQISAMYSNGTGGDSDKWSKNSHYYGLGATYAVGGLSLDLIYEALDHKGASIGLTDEDDFTKKPKTTQLLNLGGSYDFGSFKLFGAYELAIHSPIPELGYARFQEHTGKGANFNAFALGVSAPVAGGTAMLQTQYAFGKIKDEMQSDKNCKKFYTWSIGGAYLYPLSKRTQLYANAGWGTAGYALKKVDDGDETLRGWNATIGMTHTF